MSELKPCPFCGGNDLHKEKFLDLVGWIYRIYCKYCGARAESLADMETAVKRWNTRPAEDAKDREIERLKSIIEELTKPRTGGIKAAVQTARKEVLFGTDTNAPTNAPDMNDGKMEEK